MRSKLVVVNDAADLPVPIDHRQTVDAMIEHQLDGFGQERIRLNGNRLGDHQIGRQSIPVSLAPRHALAGA